MTTYQAPVTDADGTIRFVPVPVVVPPPPPPSSGVTLLAIPAGWKRALLTDFRGATALPVSEWSYGGRPGGTSGCLWDAKQLSYGPEGVTITTQWDGSANWLSAGVGTQAKWAAPVRARVYERIVDTNIDGLNHIDLLWCDPWIEEVDFYECAVSGGVLGPSTARIHNGSSANVTAPIVQAAGADSGWHCNEVMLTPSATIQGAGVYTIFVDGISRGATVIPAADWSRLVANPHWLGVQSELYNVGVAPKSAVSRRVIAAVEVLVPA